MQRLPEPRSWRANTNAEHAEMRVRWLREQLIAADTAIAAQQRIIAADGPAEIYLLSIESLRSSQRKLEHELAELMSARETEFVDFALQGRKYDGHRASAKALAVVLEGMQKLYERVGQAMGTPYPTLVIPQAIKLQCQLEVAGFFPSSFGSRFAAQTRTDLTGSSLPETSLAATFDLFNTDNPVEQAARLGQRVMVQYRHVVNTLIKAEATPKATWHTPDGQERSWIADETALITLANRLANIKESPVRQVQATGVLTGASLRRRKFEFFGDEGAITGKAPDELAAKVTQCFGKPCTITYTETRYIDETTDQEKRSRTLIDVTPT